MSISLFSIGPGTLSGDISRNFLSPAWGNPGISGLLPRVCFGSSCWTFPLGNFLLPHWKMNSHDWPTSKGVWGGG